MLKNLFFISILALFSNSLLSAQDALNKGVYYLSGSISVNNWTYGSDEHQLSNSWALAVRPSFSYFVIDRLSLSADINFIYDEQQYTTRVNQSRDIRRYYGFGPGIRYYFGGNTIVPVVGVSASLDKNIVHSSQGGYTYNVFAGINYFLSHSMALEPFISYSVSHFDIFKQGLFVLPEQDINTFSVGIRTNYFIIN